MTKKRSRLVLLAVVLVLSVMWIACRIPEPPPGTLWRQHMTPLEDEVIEDLCRKFELPSDGDLCRTGGPRYTYEFMPSIRGYFRPYENTTYEDVQKKLGVYQLMRELDVVRPDGSSYFRGRYSLTGSEVDQFGIKFSGDGVLEWIGSPID